MKSNKTSSPDPLKFKSFFSYLLSYISSLPQSARFKEICSFLKKYLFFGRFLRYVRVIFARVRAGTFLLLHAASLFLLVPVLVVLVVFSAVSDGMRFKKFNTFFSEKLKSKNIAVCFSDGFSSESIPAEYEKNTVVLVVIKDPSSLLSKHIKISDGRFFISSRYFYSLKKHILDRNQEKVKYI